MSWVILVLLTMSSTWRSSLMLMVLKPRLNSLVRQVLDSVSDAIGVYGEVSFLTAEDDDDFGVGGKLVKYNF